MHRGNAQLNQDHEDEDPSRTHFPNNNPTKQQPWITIYMIISFNFVLGFLFVIFLLYARMPDDVVDYSYPSSDFDPLTKSIRLVCTVAPSRDRCEAILASLNTRPNPDPGSLFALSLRFAIDDLYKLACLLNSTMTTSSPDNGSLHPTARHVLSECMNLCAHALDRVNRLSSAEINGEDVGTWIRAAIVDQVRCWYELDEVGSTSTPTAEISSSSSHSTVDLPAGFRVLPYEVKTKISHSTMLMMGSTVQDGVKAKVAGSTLWLANILAIHVNMEDLVYKYNNLNVEIS